MHVVVATKNRGKATEFARLLGRSFTVEALPEGISLPAEEGKTFAQNARSKAMAAYWALGGEDAVLADDSGLEVEALGGRPGVHSARLSGDGATDAENNARLLAELRGAADRSARFICVLALVLPAGSHGEDGRLDPAIVLASGYLYGEILEEPRGAGGFGYDPLFRPEGWDKTVAEVPGAEKDRVSHRAAAVRVLLDTLRRDGLIE